MSTKNRRLRTLEIENAVARTKFRIRAKQLNLNIVEQVGICARTIVDALELLEEANNYLPLTGFVVCQSSSPETGVELITVRPFRK